MNSETNYALRKQKISHCPKCRKDVYLLSRCVSDSPAFYICFDCKWVGLIREEQKPILEAMTYDNYI